MTTTALLNEAPIAFTGGLLDRADALRSQPDKIAALMDARARLLRLDGLEPCLDGDALSWRSLAEAPDEAELILLGLDPHGHACFVAVPPPEAASTALPHPRAWAAMTVLTPPELATYGTARSVASWHARHRFCPRCGGATRLARGGWQRTCQTEACGAEHFPRTDPVVIMTVEHDGDLLLGRQPRFPKGRYSALAGFVEAGESLEEAVAREIFEEAGLRVANVRYVASQPWPFPSSLMFACHATATARDLTIDHSELDDARWFTREDVAAAMAGYDTAPFGAPPRHAVAWHLLDRWLRS